MLCAKCGIELNTAVCTVCGCDHAAEEVLYLMRPSEADCVLDWGVEPYDPAEFQIEDKVLVKYLGHASQLEIPKGVVGIGDEAFRGNDTLTLIVFPDSLQWVGNYAFLGCEHLERILFNDGLTRLETSVFADCPSLKTANLPEGLTAIPEAAFSGCTSLSCVYIPDSVTEIMGAAFLGCTALNFVEGSFVRRIDNGVFAGCSALLTADFPRVETVGRIAFEGCTELYRVNFGDSLRVLETEAFRNCSDLMIVSLGTLPELYVGYNVFENCERLRRVTYRTNNGRDVTIYPDSRYRRPPVREENGFTLQGSVLLDVPDVRTVEIPNGVTRMEIGAVRDKENVAQVMVPGSVETVDAYAFANCPKLLMVSMGEGVKRISMGAFIDCPQLSCFVIPDSMEHVSGGARMDVPGPCVVLASEEWKQAHPDYVNILGSEITDE